MMDRAKLKAEMREVGKKGPLHLMRRQERIPAVVYGRGLEPIALSIAAKELMQTIRTKGMNALIELELSGGEASDASSLHRRRTGPLLVMIKDMQTQVLSHQILHLDFMKVDMKEQVTVAVPIRLGGKAIGVTKGGMIDQPRREIEVKCLPSNIPEGLDVDITHLDMGDSIHVGDLKLPEGVEMIAGEANFTIVSVVAPRKEEPAPEVAEAAAGPAAPVEGAAAPEAAAAAKKEEKPEKTEKGEKK